MSSPHCRTKIQGVIKRFLTTNFNYYPKLLTHELLYKTEQQTHTYTQGFLHPLGFWFNSNQVGGAGSGLIQPPGLLVRLRPGWRSWTRFASTFWTFGLTLNRLEEMDQVRHHPLDFWLDSEQVEGSGSGSPPAR